MAHRHHRSPAHWLATYPWAVILATGVVLFALWAYSTRQINRQVRAVFNEAANLYTGEDVQVDGLDAGKVTSVQYYGGPAIVGLGIQDNHYWPLHQGTTATLRFGTTVGNGTRYVQLDPGPSSNPRLPENGIIPVSDTTSAVEFDQVFNTFDPATRAAVQQALQGTGRTVAPRASQLAAGVASTGPALQSVSGFMGDLSADEQSLSGVVGDRRAAEQLLDAGDTGLQQPPRGLVGPDAGDPGVGADGS